MYRETRPRPAETVSVPEFWAEHFGGVRPLSRRRASRLRRTTQWQLIRRYIPDGARLLDAGCGTGDWVVLLSRHYAAEGCDYSHFLVSELQRVYPSTSWTQTDIRSMPYPAARFGGIVSWGVIEHDDAGPDAALREFWRTLAPGGVAIVTVPRDDRVGRRCAAVSGSDGNGAFYQYTMATEELGAFAERAGFKVDETGVLRTANFHLAAPRLAQRLKGLPLRVAVRLFSTIVTPLTGRYAGMIYCVARKPQDEPRS